MKRQLLGKIAVVLLLPLFLFAGVKVEVDKNALYQGDSVTYTISVTGQDIEFPVITEIAGNPIESTGSSQKISIINGDFQKTIAKSFTFTPKSSLTIPSYKVLVNGGVEETREIPVKIVKPSQDKSAPVVLDINLSKRKVHVGEMVRFDLVFKKKPNVPVYKLEIEEPQFEGFWVKKLEGVKEGVDGEYTTQTHSYLLFAQESGTLKIPSVMAKVGQLSQQSRRGIDPFFNSAFGQQVRYTKIFSNAAELEVEPLPNGLELYGDFEIGVDVDKRSVLANKPVNLTVTVDGIGNIDDVQKFELEIPGAVIYANEPVIKAGVKGDKYFGHFTQKIVIIADSSYEIPALTLHYFDEKSQQERVKKTAPIAITVTGAAAKHNSSTPRLESKIEIADDMPQHKEAAVNETETDKLDIFYAALVGFGIGALFVWLLMRMRSERKPKVPAVTPMERRIKKCKDDKALFELLLPYKNESKLISDVLHQLEENLYKGAGHNIDKKVLIDYFSGDDEKVELL